MTHLYKKYRSTTRANVTEITITELPKGSVKNILFTIISYQILCSTQKFKNCSKLDLLTVPFVILHRLLHSPTCARVKVHDPINAPGSYMGGLHSCYVYEPQCTDT